MNDRWWRGPAGELADLRGLVVGLRDVDHGLRRRVDELHDDVDRATGMLDSLDDDAWIVGANQGSFCHGCPPRAHSVPRCGVSPRKAVKVIRPGETSSSSDL